MIRLLICLLWLFDLFCLFVFICGCWAAICLFGLVVFGVC